MVAVARDRRQRRGHGLGWMLAAGGLLALAAMLAIQHEPFARAVRRLEARLPWITAERRLDQFLLASQRGDLEGMLDLADPAEVSRLGLTPEKLGRLLEGAAGTREAVALVRPRPEPLNSTQRRFNRWVNVEIAVRNGLPLPEGRLRAIVQAYNTDAGWKIGISNFLYAVEVSRRGMDGRKPRFAALCRQHGVKPELFWPNDARWETLSSTASAAPGAR